MTRRELLKILTLYGLAELMSLEASELEAKKVVIVGAGTGGMVCVSLLKLLAPKLELTIIAPNARHVYQAGQTFVAAGLMQENEIMKNTKDLLGNTHWIQEKVLSFEPENNSLICSNQEKVRYDFLIVAMGLEYDFNKIKGLHKEDIGTKNITSVFLNDLNKGSCKGGVLTHQWYKDIAHHAKNKKTRVLFTHPTGAIKCGGVTKSVIYLLLDYLKGNSPQGGDDLSENVEIVFAKPGTKFLGVDIYNEILVERSKSLKVKMQFDHVLDKIDTDKKIAYFEHKYKLVEGDEDFDAWEDTIKKERVDISYDFIHIVPSMQAVEALRTSKLSKKSGLQIGYCEVDWKTLQHKSYKNVFSVGDSAGIHLGKTAASATYQAKVAVENIIHIMKEEKLINFDGYSACPIKLNYKEVLFAEFNYKGYTQRKVQNPKKPSAKLFDIDLHESPTDYWKSVSS
ncbi:FAD-dependent oxidoreductase [Sulfurimonas sp. MAG313]|nr:FAD-dependent oxidoreductase [Sulfurimonas sp. MAG313]MDF1880066.1 FAD-dependent oxidoreductase [Sulfurimonas sp. MAG313]